MVVGLLALGSAQDAAAAGDSFSAWVCVVSSLGMIVSSHTSPHHIRSSHICSSHTRSSSHTSHHIRLLITYVSSSHTFLITFVSSSHTSPHHIRFSSHTFLTHTLLTHTLLITYVPHHIRSSHIRLLITIVPHTYVPHHICSSHIRHLITYVPHHIRTCSIVRRLALTFCVSGSDAQNNPSSHHLGPV